jgi:hypothetical protein
MKRIKLSFLVLLFMGALACGGGNDSPPPPPSAATLIFPEDNTECNEGVVVSPTQSSVTFMWNAAENADSYTLSVRNLDTGSSQTFNTNNTQQEVTLLRGVPYAWRVISKANGVSQTAESAEWRFYNAGAAVQNYAPFPAAVVSPAMGVAVNAVGGMVTLSWTASDVDGDITGYEVYAGTVNPPVALAGNSTAATLNVAVTSGTVYYWQVVTNDAEGNSSFSDVFEFRVN